MTVSYDDIASSLHAANEELIAFVDGCSDDAWRAPVTGDGWTVAADAHHCAVGHVLAIGWIENLRQDQDVPGSAESHDQMNADHAAEFAAVTKEETVALLRENGARAAAFLRSISPEESERSGVHGPAGGVRLTVARMAGAFPGHVMAHLARMRDAVEIATRV